MIRPSRRELLALVVLAFTLASCARLPSDRGRLARHLASGAPVVVVCALARCRVTVEQSHAATP